MSSEGLKGTERIVLCAAGVRLVCVWVLVDGLINLGHNLLEYFIANSIVQFPVLVLKGLFDSDMLQYVWSSVAINAVIAAILWFNSKSIARLLLSKL